MATVLHPNKFLGVSLVGTLNCSLCRVTISRGQEFYRWHAADSSINLPDPTELVKGLVLCPKCYVGGENLEQRLLTKRTKLYNNTDGCVCLVCNGFFSFVEPNQPNGTYICFDDRK